MNLCTLEGRELEVALNAEYKETGDLLGAIDALDSRLVEHACYLATKGISYRDFLVGGAIPALFLAETTYQMLADQAGEENLELLIKLARSLGNVVLLEGANNSPEFGSPRDCAERGMCRLADMFVDKKIGRLIFGRIYTAAPGDRKLLADTCGYDATTLPPCAACRPIIENCSASWPNMPYTTLASDGPARQNRVWREIFSMHVGRISPPSSAAIMAARTTTP